MDPITQPSTASGELETLATPGVPMPVEPMHTDEEADIDADVVNKIVETYMAELASKVKESEKTGTCVCP